jgi:hypothetical protein
MRMGGSVALALPDETCSTVVLTMSSTDAKQYESVVKQPLKTTMARLLTQGGKSFSLEMGLSLRRHVCARAATKLAALRRDLMQQRDSDQAVHAGELVLMVFVLFRQFNLQMFFLFLRLCSWKSMGPTTQNNDTKPKNDDDDDNNNNSGFHVFQGRAQRSGRHAQA